MAATNAAAWVLGSRWERPGYGVELRARLQAPPLIGRGGDLVQVAPFVYPVLVVVAPGWAYEGWLNWSTEIDLVLQAVGLGLWALGIAVGVWAAQAIGGYGAVSGVTVDHQLVSDGPYRYVRHPVYTAMIAVAAGTTLVFRSYLVLGVAALSIVTHLWWAAAEEKLLSSPEALGDAYRTYASHTGRFLPRVRQARRPTGRDEHDVPGVKLRLAPTAVQLDFPLEDDEGLGFAPLSTVRACQAHLPDPRSVWGSAEFFVRRQRGFQ